MMSMGLGDIMVSESQGHANKAYMVASLAAVWCDVASEADVDLGSAETIGAGRPLPDQTMHNHFLPEACAEEGWAMYMTSAPGGLRAAGGVVSRHVRRRGQPVKALKVLPWAGMERAPGRRASGAV